MKRVFTIILCLALMLSMAVSASAVDITIAGGISGAEYSAYRLLDLTLNADGTSFGYTVNPKYETVLETYFHLDSSTPIEKVSETVNARLGTLGDKSDELYALAKEIYKLIDAAKLAADYVSEDDRIANAAQGYYLVYESKLGETGENEPTDTRSLIMLDTLGKDNLEITTKEKAPEINKQVFVANDSSVLAGETWREYADYDIGDEIPFQITGSVSGRYEHYETYNYKFEDTMSEGLNMKTKKATVDGQEVDVIDGMTITIGNVGVTEHFTITLKENKQGFTAVANLKAVEKEVQKSDPTFVILHNTSIVVSYNAILTDAAKSGVQGNTNTVKLFYSNDPYHGDSWGNTPPDTNVVFTYTAILNKVMEDGKTPLAGAEFKLEKFNLKENRWIELPFTFTEGTTTFNFEGLDVGMYRLSETKAPAGYSPIVPFEFQVVAEYDTTKNPVELTGLAIQDRDGYDLASALKMEVSVDKNAGTFVSNIVNKAGTALPTTGGMGTTLIYTVGALLALAAIVMLVTKKRMTNAE